MERNAAEGGSPAAAEGEVLTQLDILIRLYEGAIRFLDEAIAACEAGQVASFKERLGRGRRIIEEFRKTLDFERGGAVPSQLDDLYAFMLDSLAQAELTHEVPYIQRVVEQLRTLLEGWRGAKTAGIP
ncbi:MAG: flagellar protein FliS [Magnetococcales bacterium]|nr:flagellar protein FliS [Magnetococcales bacterium]MBF0156001.1 flagellar protein FliS [Magnetococcales bacterium]